MILSIIIIHLDENPLYNLLNFVQSIKDVCGSSSCVVAPISILKWISSMHLTSSRIVFAKFKRA